jgi:ABC-type uncharacterized transport system permease subunit
VILETALIFAGMGFYLFATLLSIRHFASGTGSPWAGRGTVLAGALFHAAALIVHGNTQGAFPAQNLHDFGLLLITTMMMVVLVIDLAKRVPSLLYGAAPVAFIGIAVAGVIHRTAGGGSIAAPMSIWTGLHVLTTTSGYACFLIAFIAGVIYMAVQRQLRAGTVESPLPSLETALRVNRGSVWAGFLLLTAGIVLGYLYARSAPPSAGWRVDPKVILTTVTWACYGVALLPILRGRRAVVASMVSFLSVILTLWASVTWTDFHVFR